MRSNGVGENSETNEEHVQDCVKEERSLVRGRFDRHDEGLHVVVHVLKTIF